MLTLSDVVVSNLLLRSPEVLQAPEREGKKRVPNPAEPHDFRARDGDQATRPPSNTGFNVGQAIGGRYEIISCIGSGGMGLVYRVNQVYLKKEFALKTIEKSQLTESAVRRFQQEARTTFSLDHPSIISVYDFGVLGDGSPFLVMEMLHGETLGDCLKRCGSLPVEQAIPIFVQICFGLAYAHEAGIVHRDIKPNNIMLLEGLPLGTEGSVKILDFGIAKLTSHEGGEIQALTRTGDIFGSPLYMSPEQCSGIKVDHRADIYSLGCVFFEALTGSTPFIGDNALSTMLKHQSEQPPTLREASMGSKFPQALEDIVATMLAKSPDHRYQNLGVLAHDLGALLRGAPVPSKSVAGGTGSASASASAKTPKTISLSINKFVAILAVSALSFVLLGFGLDNFLHRTAAPVPVENINAPPAKEESLLPGGDTPSEIADKEAQIESEYQKVVSIHSEIASGKDSGNRIFNFPKTPIGQVNVSNIVKGQLEPRKDVDASGEKLFPEKALYHLLVGSMLSAAIYHPIIFTKIAPGEFVGLTISRPKEIVDQHKQLSDSELAAATLKILTTVKKWTKLTYLELHHLPITSEIVETLNSMERIDRLILYDPVQIPPHVLNHLSPPNLVSLTIRRMDHLNELICELPKYKKLRILQFVHVSFSQQLKPSVFEQLHLRNIEFDTVLGLTDDMLKSVLRMKGLESISITGSLTPVQEELLKQALNNHMLVVHKLASDEK
jgi:serine/threonine protein kinase